MASAGADRKLQDWIVTGILTSAQLVRRLQCHHVMEILHYYQLKKDMDQTHLTYIR